MTRLSLVLPFHDGESIQSFCSRLAAAHGISHAREFCRHMGFQFQDLVAGKEPAIWALSQLSGVSVNDLKRGVMRREGSKFYVNDEVLTKEQLLRHRVRVCPHCLFEDERSADGPPEARAYGRLAWLITFVRTCPVHECLLVEMPEPIKPSRHHDFSVAWAAFRSQVYSTETVSQKTSALERAVEDRLTGLRKGSSWLETLPLNTLGELVECVGATITHGHQFMPESLDRSQWVEAGDVAYRLLSQGEDALVDFLLTLQRSVWEKRGLRGRAILHGRLYAFLSAQSDAAFEPIRQKIVEKWVASFPIGPEDNLFGLIGLARRFHSVISASEQHNTHPATLRRFLLGHPVLGPAIEGIPNERTMISVSDMDSAIADWKDRIRPKQAAARVGLRPTQLRELAMAGYFSASAIVAPGTTIDYSVKAVEGFMADLRRFSTLPFAEATELRGIHDLSSDLYVRPVTLVGMVLTGDLRFVAFDPDIPDVSAIFLQPEEVRQMLSSGSQDGITVVNAAKFLDIAFSTLQLLIKTGHIHVRLLPDNAGRLKKLVLLSDLMSFRESYVTLKQFGKLKSVGFMTVKRQFDEAGIKPVIGGEGFGAFYRRDQAFSLVWDSRSTQERRRSENRTR